MPGNGRARQLQRSQGGARRGVIRLSFQEDPMRIASGPLAPASLLLVCACSGGGSSGGAVVGLSLPDQMSVVTAQGSGVVSHVGVPGFPSDSDYATDEQHAWVYDPSMDTLGTVNQILCMV